MIEMLFKSLRGTDWELLTGFVSPAFFEVVPTIGMARVFGRIVKDYANKDGFDKHLKKARKSLPASAPAGIKSDPAAQGRAVLELYFRQIFDQPVAVLDLRTAAFDFSSGKVRWNPKPLFFEWSPEFISGVRDMYAGFYMNDQARYMEGLRALDLAHADDIFKRHFGEGDQSRVEFSLAHFKKSFQAIFESCKKHKTRLHPDFFALGAYLLCLYENLESLNVPLDVRSAFDAAVD